MKATNSYITEHKTQITPIQNGFDYRCLSCGYHATYTKNGDGRNHLLVIDEGKYIERVNNVVRTQHLETQVVEVLQRHFEAIRETEDRNERKS